MSSVGIMVAPSKRAFIAYIIGLSVSFYAIIPGNASREKCQTPFAAGGSGGPETYGFFAPRRGVAGRSPAGGVGRDPGPGAAGEEARP
jgi:hypothetical protein